MKNLTLIIGSARSGKSKLAESLAKASNLPVYYLATMQTNPADIEQTNRINKHRSHRPAQWQTIEVEDNLCQVLNSISSARALIIIECLSLYVSRLLMDAGNSDTEYFTDRQEEQILAHIDELLSAMEKHLNLQFVVVTNEVGAGVVPDTPLGRAFRDVLGFVNQRIAANADTVWLTVAGLHLALKSSAQLASAKCPVCANIG